MNECQEIPVKNPCCISVRASVRPARWLSNILAALLSPGIFAVAVLGLPVAEEFLFLIFIVSCTGAWWLIVRVSLELFSLLCCLSY